MKTTFKYLYLLAFALTPLFTACNEDEEETGSVEKAGYDLKASDGKVTVLQTATEGNGLNIVLMGDGYTADDISAGTYDEVMAKAAETIFSISPMKGLRRYFNVYAVQKVSVNNLMDGYTALGTTTNSAGTTTAYPSLDAANDKAVNFASDVPGFDESNTVICVVMNTELGRGITSHLTDGYSGLLACSYAPHKGDYDGYDFRQRLIHELVGHAIGKLADEYDPDGGTYSNSMMNRYIYGQAAGWYQNIWIYDAYNLTTPWTELIDDPQSRYAGENLADPRVWTDDFNDRYYLGSDAAGSNYAYRATETSIMRSTAEGTTFNAPSRRAIYNNVMRIATGTTPTYEEFVTFDQADN